MFSDLHLETPFAWADTGLARRRRQALREALAKLVALTLEEPPAAVLCGGDLYEHDRISLDTGEFLRTMFERLHPIPVFVAPGNHDWYGPQSIYNQVRWSPNVHVFREAHLEPVAIDDGITLWGAAHPGPAHMQGLLDGFRVDRSGLQLALFHGSERGLLPYQETGKSMHAPFDARQIEQAGLHHAFLGHYHQPRDADHFTYPGNPEPLMFGEDGERGVVIATCLPDGTVRRKRIRVAVSQVHNLEVDVTGSESRQDVLERVAQALGPLSGSARVTLVGEVGPAVDLRTEDLRREDLASDLDGLVVRSRMKLRYDFDAIAAESTVRGQFVRDVQAADLPQEERVRVLVSGLRALEGRADLEVL